MTVKGPIDPSELGVTMTHEHPFCDLGCWQASPQTPLQESLANAPISIKFLGELRRDALVFGDNLILQDEETLLHELQDLASAGGRAIVDLTVIGLEPAIGKLRAIAERTDLNIIAGCGYYIHDSHPPTIRESSVDAVAEELLRQVRSGIGGTNVLPGAIGEIGTGQPVTDDEWKMLEATCDVKLGSPCSLTSTRCWMAPQRRRLLSSCSITAYWLLGSISAIWMVTWRFRISGRFSIWAYIFHSILSASRHITTASIGAADSMPKGKRLS